MPGSRTNRSQQLTRTLRPRLCAPPAAFLPRLRIVTQLQPIAAVDVRGAIQGLVDEVQSIPGLRGDYLRGLALSFQVMWDLVTERLDQGDPVPYERAVQASTGSAPSPSQPAARRARVAELLDRRGYATVDDWRRARPVAMAKVESYGAEVIDAYDRLTECNLVPHLPEDSPYGVTRVWFRFSCS